MDIDKKWKRKNFLLLIQKKKKKSVLLPLFLSLGKGEG